MGEHARRPIEFLLATGAVGGDQAVSEFGHHTDNGRAEHEHASGE